MPRFVEQSPFLRQTWALLKRNAILHVYSRGSEGRLILESVGCVDFFADHFDACDIVLWSLRKAG